MTLKACLHFGTYLIVLALSVEISAQQEHLVILSRPTGVFAMQYVILNSTTIKSGNTLRLFSGKSDDHKYSSTDYSYIDDNQLTDDLLNDASNPAIRHQLRAFDYDPIGGVLFSTDFDRQIRSQRFNGKSQTTAKRQKSKQSVSVKATDTPTLIHESSYGTVISIAFDRFSNTSYFITQRRGPRWCVEAVSVATRDHLVLICSDDTEKLGALGPFCEPDSLAIDNEQVANAFVYFVDSGCKNGKPRVLYIATDGSAFSQVRFDHLMQPSGSEVVTYGVTSLTIGNGLLHFLLTREAVYGEEYTIVQCNSRGLSCVKALSNADLIEVAERNNLGLIGVRAISYIVPSTCSSASSDTCAPWAVLDTMNRLLSCSPFLGQSESIRCRITGNLNAFFPSDMRSQLPNQTEPEESVSTYHGSKTDDVASEIEDESSLNRVGIPDEYDGPSDEDLFMLRVFVATDSADGGSKARTNDSFGTACTTLNCSFMCLRSPSSRDRFARCVCAPKNRLAADGRSCTPDPNAIERVDAAVLVGARNAEINFMPFATEKSFTLISSPPPSALDTANAHLLIRTFDETTREDRGTIDALELDRTTGTLFFIDSETQYVRTAALRRDTLDGLVNRRPGESNTTSPAGSGKAKRLPKRMKSVAPVASEPLLNSGETARAVAFDWFARQLYVIGKPKITDLATDSGFIQVFITKPTDESDPNSSLRLTSRLVLVHSGLQEPKAIAVDPVAGYLFWTDLAVLGGGGHREKGRLERALLDGSKRYVIAGTASDTSEATMNWPTAIALDPPNKLIYVADAYRTELSLTTDASAVLVFSYSGKFVERISLGETSSVQALALLGSALFFADPANRRVGSYDVKTKVRKTHLQDVFEVRSLLALRLSSLPDSDSSSNQQSDSACRKLNCSHFCFFRPVEPTYCACPIGMRLDSANRSCAQPAFTILYAKERGITSLAFGAADSTPQSSLLQSASGLKPKTIAFDAARRLVFWTDPIANRLIAARLDGAAAHLDVAPVPFDGARLGASITYEPLSETLYIADPAADRIDAARIIFSDGLAGNDNELQTNENDASTRRGVAVYRRTVAWMNVSKPRAIAVDGLRGIVVFSNADGRQIEKASLDGSSNRTLLLNLSDETVYSLAIDSIRQQVYFTTYRDENLRTDESDGATVSDYAEEEEETETVIDIEAVALDGNGTERHVIVPKAYALSVYVIDRYLFWSNARTRAIERCSLLPIDSTANQSCVDRVIIWRDEAPRSFIVFGTSSPKNVSVSTETTSVAATTRRPANHGRRKNSKGQRNSTERRLVASCSACMQLCFPTGSTSTDVNEKFMCECETHYWITQSRSNANRTECDWPHVVLLAAQAERIMRLVPLELRTTTTSGGVIVNRTNFDQDPVDTQLPIRLLSGSDASYGYDAIGSRRERIARIAYDSHSGHVYALIESFGEQFSWMAIRRANLALRDAASSSHAFLTLLVADSANSRPFDLAIDGDGAALFYTDQLTNVINATGLDQRPIGVIISGDSGDRLRLLAIAPMKATLFWTNERLDSGGVRIESARLDGTRRTTLVSGLRNVTALLFDESSSRLYWFDAATRRIEMLRDPANGTAEKTTLCIFDLHGDSSSAINSMVIASLGNVETMFAVVGNRVVRVFVENAKGGMRETCQVAPVWDDSRQYADNNVVALASVDWTLHPTASDKAPPTCSDLRCSHLCITSQQGVSECACPLLSGMRLRENRLCEPPIVIPETNLHRCLPPRIECPVGNTTVCTESITKCAMLAKSRNRGNHNGNEGPAIVTDPAAPSLVTEYHERRVACDADCLAAQSLTVGPARDGSNNNYLIGVAVAGAFCVAVAITLACIALRGSSRFSGHRCGVDSAVRIRRRTESGSLVMLKEGPTHTSSSSKDRYLNEPPADRDPDWTDDDEPNMSVELPLSSPPTPATYKRVAFHGNYSRANSRLLASSNTGLRSCLASKFNTGFGEDCMQSDTMSTQRCNSLAPSYRQGQQAETSTYYLSAATDQRSARVCGRSCSKCKRRILQSQCSAYYYAGSGAASVASREIIDLHAAAACSNFVQAASDVEPLNPPPTPDPSWSVAFTDCRKVSQTSANASVLSVTTVRSSELRHADESRRLSSVPTSSESNCIDEDPHPPAPSRHRPHHHAHQFELEQVEVELYVPVGGCSSSSHDCARIDPEMETDVAAALGNGFVAPPPSVRGASESSEKRRRLRERESVERERRKYRRVRVKAYARRGQPFYRPTNSNNRREEPGFCECATVCDCPRCAAAAHRHRARLTGVPLEHVPTPSDCGMGDGAKSHGHRPCLRPQLYETQASNECGGNSNSGAGSSNSIGTNSSRLHLPSRDRASHRNCHAPPPSLVDADREGSDV